MRTRVLFAVVVAITLHATSVHAADLLVTVKDKTGKPIENAVVWVAGVPAGPVPTEPAVLDQLNFQFRPSLLVARKGQTLEVKNSDAVSHNVNVQSDCCRFNETTAPGGAHKVKLELAGVATVLCNFHAQMRATVLVLDAPHARTDVKGEARLDVPAGTRKLHAFALDHERPSPVEVTIPESGVARATVELLALARTEVVADDLSWAELVQRIRGELDRALVAARGGNVDAARVAAKHEANDRYWRGPLRSALRAKLGVQPWNELDEQMASLVSDLGKVAANASPEERARLVAGLEERVTSLVKRLTEEAAELAPREKK